MLNGNFMKRFLIGLALLLCISFYIVSTQKRSLIVTTTTSLYATGLLDELKERFESENPSVMVKFIATGTGEALKRASQGGVDLVLVHAPSLEKQYMEKGVIERNGSIFAYNYFILVGPPDDPAEASGKSVIDAFKSIYSAGERGRALFISRGDNSGTNVREMQIWNMAGLNPKNRSWYIESGSDMVTTLSIANEKQAYTLVDVGTWLFMKDKLKLKAIVDRGDELINIYSAYIVPSGNTRDASAFKQFLLSREGQEIINNFRGGGLFFSAIWPNDRTSWLRSVWEKWSEIKG
jgi:tungstate transport system substrate-binding protein